MKLGALGSGLASLAALVLALGCGGASHATDAEGSGAPGAGGSSGASTNDEGGGRGNGNANGAGNAGDGDGDAGAPTSSGGSPGAGNDGGSLLAASDGGSSPLPGVGATVPFTTVEAEASGNTTTGSITRLTGLPGATDSSPELEASGRAYVELARTGDALTIPDVPATNALVVRFSIPDAPGGGGTSATLNLYVNGQKQTSLTLDSGHAWLYGDAGTNGQSNSPAAGSAHVFWDEARFLVADIAAGSTIELRKDADCTAAYYRIDLLDLEVAPPALAPPAAGTYLDVTSSPYNADASGESDSSKAIVSALKDAAAQKKSVWLPAGTFVVSQSLDVAGVAMHGAGMWRTTLYRKVPFPKPSGGRYNLSLSGTGATITDFFLDSNGTGRGDADSADYGVNGGGTGWLVQNVWITHTQTGLWINGTGGVSSGNRIRFSYADGMTIDNGSQNITVEQNHIRATGDDGMATLSETTSSTTASGNVFRNNTVEAVWWGGNMDLAGGSAHVIENNYFADNAVDGCLVVNMPSSYAMKPLTSATVSGNVFVRCGGNMSSQQRGAIWVYAGSAATDGMVMKNNTLTASLFHGLHLTGGSHQSLVFDDNSIDMGGAGEQAIYVEPEVKGAGSFGTDTITSLASGTSAFTSAAGGNYTVTKSGDAW